MFLPRAKPRDRFPHPDLANTYFGSGVAVTRMGFILGLFVFDRNHPEALALHKRPVRPIIPAFMERGTSTSDSA